jgi:hypothetical protein
VPVDPDRSRLGGLQDHLHAHAFSYGEIAQLMPDGEGGTQQQKRDRVKNRLQHRRRERWRAGNRRNEPAHGDSAGLSPIVYAMSGSPLDGYL